MYIILAATIICYGTIQGSLHVNVAIDGCSKYAMHACNLRVDRAKMRF